MGKGAPLKRDAGAMQGALERLRAMIVLGELNPGEQIRQQEMAEVLGVSRVPLREAMNLLADQGLLVHRRNQGYFVAKRVPDDLVQIRRMLYLLENELLATVAWPDATVLAELEALNEEIAPLLTRGDVLALSELNRRFHHTIFALSPYSLIHQEVQRLWDWLDPVFMAKFTRPEYLQRMTEEHQAILQPLRDRDRDALLRLMNEHRYGAQSVPVLTAPSQTGEIHEQVD